MLTKIILDGAMGKHFGRRWDFEVSSPAEALRMIEANKPGLRAWVVGKMQKFSGYKVTCEYENGSKETLDETAYPLLRKLKSIRFTPVVEGSGSIGRIVIGAVMIAASFIPGMPPMFAKYLFQAGVSMVLSGVVGLLTPVPTKGEQTERSDKTSYYFDGPANTTVQGVPVQLIYGRVLVGSHAISAKMDIDDLATEAMTAGAVVAAELKAETFGQQFAASQLQAATVEYDFNSR